jgi:hypothetical protein
VFRPRPRFLEGADGTDVSEAHDSNRDVELPNDRKESRAASTAVPTAGAHPVVVAGADDGWDDTHHTISGTWDDLGLNPPAQPTDRPEMAN